MSLIKVYNHIKSGFHLINLKYVSNIYLKNNKINIVMANERESIFGSFLFFGGGDSKNINITFDTENEAKKEFEDITKRMENYFTK